MAASKLQEKLESGKFAVTVEMGPPKSASGEDFVKGIRSLKGLADAYNVTDNQTATVRLSSLAGSVFLLREGMEPIMQLTCRDRNRIAIQSDILGAVSLGIRNVLCISGDHQKFGNQPDTRNVYDIDSTQELMILKRMRDEGTLWSGDSLVTAPSLYLGAAANPFGDPQEMHIMRLGNKCLAGAQFIQTQPVYDFESFSEWMAALRRLGMDKKAKFIIGVLPLKSLKMTRFMANNVPGTVVPDDIVRRMAAATDEKAEGMRIASETIEKIRSVKGVSGIHMMPVGWLSCIQPLLKSANLTP
jgi:methylenetetrahydrofolate reductase (NADPH)